MADKEIRKVKNGLMNEVPKKGLKTLTKEEPFVSGRRSCKGCGKALAARLAAKATADSSANLIEPAPGISEQPVSFSSYAYGHDPVTTTGMIEKVLSAVTKMHAATAEETESSDGSARKAVIGIDRNVLMDDYLALTEVAAGRRDLLFICFDNEPHMAGLIQKAVPEDFILNEAHAPVTELDVLRVMEMKARPALIDEGDFSYFATACPSYPRDYVEKINRALMTPGNSFILVLTPCPTDWIFSPEKSIEVGKKAVETGYFPLYEILEGAVQVNRPAAGLRPLSEFIEAQKRFFTFPPELMPFMETAVSRFHEALLNDSEVADES